jgi:hypothetical protein
MSTYKREGSEGGVAPVFRPHSKTVVCPAAIPPQPPETPCRTSSLIGNSRLEISYSTTSSHDYAYDRLGLRASKAVISMAHTIVSAFAGYSTSIPAAHMMSPRAS